MGLFERWRKREQRASAWKRGDILASILTDPGCHRDINEDSGCLIVPSDAEQFAGKGILALVADGMGGHQSGEIASRAAVEIISRTYYQSDRAVPEALEHAFQLANRVVWKRSQESEHFHGMGTTATALVLHDGLGYSSHVGDSRLYLLRGDSLLRMTEDHSLVQDMVRKGLLSAEEATHHADRNVIVRALGTKADLAVSNWSEPLPVRRGDRFVLCSDGLYDLVSEAEIRNIVEVTPPKTACEVLVRAARHRGGYDNITVAVLSVRTEGGLEELGMRETRESEVPAI